MMSWRASVALAIAAMVVVVVACGTGSMARPAAPALGPAPTTTAERILGLLPAGAQVVAEIDLARLRANPIIGETLRRAFAEDAVVLPGGVPGADGARVPSPLATADLVVLAAYGVGTSDAATLTVIASSTQVVGARAIPGGLYALGPAEWVDSLEQRATITAGAPLGAPVELLELRGRALPPNAPGAALRLVARLSFDARVALARQVGLENAPGQVSIWGDVVDDLAIVIDADAADPGEPATKQAVARLQATMKGALVALAKLATARALGVSSSLLQARQVVRGTWVRTIIAIGPAHLRRVVERASTLMPTQSRPEPRPE